MDAYSQLISKIIKEQEAIIGPVALEQAKKVDGLEIADKDTIKINGNANEVVTKLVIQYEKLFGRASIEVCREAVRQMTPQLSQVQLPDILK